MYSFNEDTRKQFATFDASTGTLRFWNRETVPSVGDKDPEGHNVDSVFTELNYQDNEQSVFNSILSSIKEAIAVDRVSFTNTSYMFYTCLYLTKLDVSNFDTSNVTDMSYMFYGCFELTTLDVSNFDTSNVTDIRAMFAGCSDLTLDCSHWNVDKVTSHKDFNHDAPKVIPPVWKN